LGTSGSLSGGDASASAIAMAAISARGWRDLRPVALGHRPDRPCVSVQRFATWQSPPQSRLQGTAYLAWMTIPRAKSKRSAARQRKGRSITFDAGSCKQRNIVEHPLSFALPCFQPPETGPSTLVPSPVRAVLSAHTNSAASPAPSRSPDQSSINGLSDPGSGHRQQTARDGRPRARCRCRPAGCPARSPRHSLVRGRSPPGRSRSAAPR
jgi:hypothetical protein